MPTEIIVVGLLAVAGFLAGGVYSTWKTARLLSLLLAACAVLAAGGAVTWWLSG